MKSFETFKYKMLGSKFVKCLANFKMTSQFLLNFASFFMIMIDNSSVNFKLIIFILWNKESHKSLTFETFKCSGENFSFLMSFSKPQVSYSSNFASPFSAMKDNSSVIFRSNIKYFA